MTRRLSRGSNRETLRYDHGSKPTEVVLVIGKGVGVRIGLTSSSWKGNLPQSRQGINSGPRYVRSVTGLEERRRCVCPCGGGRSRPTTYTVWGHRDSSSVFYIPNRRVVCHGSTSGSPKSRFPFGDFGSGVPPWVGPQVHSTSINLRRKRGRVRTRSLALLRLDETNFPL